MDFNSTKTEAILFSRSPNTPTPNLTFINTRIKFVRHHKYFGLSVDGKCHEHIANITKPASKLVGIMRRSPLLEILWIRFTDVLDKIQHEAARIVIGLPRSVSLRDLYSDIDWMSLSGRRQYVKLLFMHKLHTGNCPEFLRGLLPNAVESTTSYSLRASQDYSIVERIYMYVHLSHQLLLFGAVYQFMYVTVVPYRCLTWVS